MKKLCIITLTLIAFQASSQTFGVKGGVNLGKEKASASGISITSDFYVSVMAGIYGEVATNTDGLFFAPELIYSQDGGKYNLFGTTGIDKYSVISVPLLMKYYPSEKFNIHGGMQMGLILKATAESDGESFEFTEDVNRLTLSFDIGGEYDLGGVNLGARYILGLTNLNAADGDGTINLNTLQIYLAVPFNK